MKHKLASQSFYLSNIDSTWHLPSTSILVLLLVLEKSAMKRSNNNVLKQNYRQVWNCRFWGYVATRKLRISKHEISQIHQLKKDQFILMNTASFTQVLRTLSIVNRGGITLHSWNPSTLKHTYTENFVQKLYFITTLYFIRLSNSVHTLSLLICTFYFVVFIISPLCCIY